MKRAGLIVILALLGGCAPTVTNFNPPSVAAPSQRVPGSYTVAVVGDFNEELNARGAKTTPTIWGYAETNLSSDNVNIVPGDTLRQAVANALQASLGNVSLVNDEATARRSGEAVIVRYEYGNIVIVSRQLTGSTESFATVDLYGKATIVGADGRAGTLPLSGSGNGRYQAFDSSRNMTAAQTATEEAMARFAANAVSAVALARRPNAIAPVSDR